ncbi:MAG: hypothetical protein PHS71_04240 [Proteiniphilum sp.]|nr:hypothetical protein [Proteiniphilum sp.]
MENITKQSATKCANHKERVKMKRVPVNAKKKVNNRNGEKMSRALLFVTHPGESNSNRKRATAGTPHRSIERLTEER